ncbi:MAG TPA: FkbM family methyltransferase [Gemmatimonadales bacterium]|nr:FkbM family methyltransferase [Gemmatimonadales bacterium]
MVKTIVQAVANRLGYHIGRNPPENSLGRDLQSLLRRLRITSVLDVGAHQGEYGTLLRTLGYLAQIVSFEPVAESFAVLAARGRADPNWKAHAMALGATTGTLAMRVTAGSTFSSFRAPSAFGLAQFGAKLEVVKHVDVPVERLDRVLDACVGPAAHVFLKCDTQGHDLEVVRGAGRAISRIQGLQVELPLKAVYDGVPSFTESFNELRALGFELVGLYPVTRDRRGNVIEVDCLMQRGPPDAPPRFS